MTLSPDHSAASSSSSSSAHGRHTPPDFLSFSAPDFPISDDSPIFTLFQSELDHVPRGDYVRRCRDRSIDLTARQDSINWILKVHSHYNFKPVTAILSVNYFDRFLSSNFLPQRNGWPFQLLSVACLSLAAKMEEPEVPLLLDLQIFEPTYVFEPKTVQRMELWVMSILNWRLRVVTPFDFLHHFISDLPSSSALDSSDGDGDDFHRLFLTSSDLILSTTRVIDFLGFPPSTIAAAAVLCAAGERFDSPAVCSHFLAADRVEMVRSCHQLMEEYVIDTCPAELRKQRRGGGAEQPDPPSPVGVLDAAACGSCDTRLDNPGSTSQGHAAEPQTKRLRSSAPDVQDQ